MLVVMLIKTAPGRLPCGLGCIKNDQGRDTGLTVCWFDSCDFPRDFSRVFLHEFTAAQKKETRVRCVPPHHTRQALERSG
jgi:hypothetical protein